MFMFITSYIVIYILFLSFSFEFDTKDNVNKSKLTRSSNKLKSPLTQE